MEINIIKRDDNSFIAADEESEKHIIKMSKGEIFNVKIRKTDRRSLEQNNLFWKCCSIVADNTDDKNWNTKEKVKDQCLIEEKLYDYFIQYENKKTGETSLNIKLKSISFENMKHLEACDFFTKAFDYMSAKIGMTADQLLNEATGGTLRTPSTFEGEIFPAKNML